MSAHFSANNKFCKSLLAVKILECFKEKTTRPRGERLVKNESIYFIVEFCNCLDLFTTSVSLNLLKQSMQRRIQFQMKYEKFAFVVLIT